MSNKTKFSIVRTQQKRGVSHRITIFVITLCLLVLGAQQTMRAQQWTDSVSIYTQGAQQGDVHSIERLAECYHWGRGVERNLLNVMFLFEQAHDF